MLSRLSIKLFFIILLVNLLISGMIYLSVARSIDQGFLDYIQRGQRHQVEALAEVIGERWAVERDWSWLRERGAWGQLLRDSLGSQPDEPLEPSSAPTDSAPPFIPPLSDPRQFVLFDADDHRLEGRRPADEALARIAIVVNGETIGALGYRTPERVSTALDQIFVHNQLRNLAMILLALLPASLVLAAGIALWLGRRARLMALATQLLTLGDYRVRLPTQGQDELSRLSSDINTLARTLEQNRAARRRWGADIAHELRTPLAILRGELEAMQDGVRPMNVDNLRSLSQEVELLSRLVNDLRLLAQTDTHSLDAPMERLDLGELLSIQLEERHYALENAGFELETRIDPGIHIQGAPYRLRQLWRNLLDNSQAYTDAPGRIRVTLEATRTHAVVNWEDSMPGVPVEALERLTERLFRLDASRNRKRGGSGLGLSIAQALVELHGGMMSASLAPLGGLRWTIHLPRVA